MIYGANASGKTNVIKAFDFMQKFIFVISKNILPTDKIQFTPFKFDEKTPEMPSRFEVTFIYENIKYFYGFSLDKEKIYEEYLYHYPKGRQAVVFERTNTDEYKNVKKTFVENTGKNKLYLITLAQNNDETAIKVLEWFNSTGILLSNERVHRMVTIDKFKKDKKQVIDFLKNIDSGIKDLIINESEMTKNQLPPDMPDEIKELIFTTHDTSQLNAKIFRKDQIYITEKNMAEQYTDLYSLQDIKGIRTDNFQKSYLQGKYGGIPFIDLEGAL